MRNLHNNNYARCCRLTKGSRKTKDSVKINIHHHVELERVRTFFGHTRGDMASLLLGALLISLILFESGTKALSLALWLITTNVVVLITMRFEQGVKRTGVTAENCQRLMRQKFILGGAVSLLYGVSAFLLPDNAAAEYEIYLFLILSTTITNCTLAFAVVANFYLIVAAATLIPFTLHLVIQYVAHPSTLYLLFINGAIIWQALIGHKAKLVSNTAIKVIALQQQLRQKIEQHKQDKVVIQHMAYHDPLTDLGNRRYFQEVFARSLNLAQRNHSKFALLSLDLDDFKPVNDQHGHAIGDALLKAVATRLLAHIRASDFCTRMGGDEFFILVENINDADAAGEIVNKLKNALAQPFDLAELSIQISTSIGCAVYPDEGVTMDDLCLVADKKMYREKRNK